MADHSDSFSLTPSKYLCGVPDGMQPIVVSQQLETLQAGPQVIQPPCLSRVTGGACKKNGRPSAPSLSKSRSFAVSRLGLLAL